jgi:hypothetical protein
MGASPAFPSVLVAAVLLSFVLASFRANFGPVRQAYEAAVPLDLPGARRVRVDPAGATIYQQLAHDLSSRCNGLITLPGFNSLYLFTGIEPPTRLNTTAWFTMLTQAQQDTIIRRLTETQGTVCAVRNATMISLVSWIARRTDLEDVPLAHSPNPFVPVARIGAKWFGARQLHGGPRRTDMRNQREKKGGRRRDGPSVQPARAKTCSDPWRSPTTSTVSTTSRHMIVARTAELSSKGPCRRLSS